MDTEKAFVDDTGEGQSIECTHEALVDVLVVLLYRFAHEVVGESHAARLVVASQELDVLGVVDLEGHDESHHLHGVGPAVHVVAQEQQVTVLGDVLVDISHNGQDLHEVVVLAMYVADDKG